jgi:hypothetical protein
MAGCGGLLANMPQLHIGCGIADPRGACADLVLPGLRANGEPQSRGGGALNGTRAGYVQAGWQRLPSRAVARALPCHGRELRHGGEPGQGHRPCARPGGIREDPGGVAGNWGMTARCSTASPFTCRWCRRRLRAPNWLTTRSAADDPTDAMAPTTWTSPRRPPQC